ncbi:MAG: L-serine ammonia-lyase, iron-sulfur-dependent, subunit alpha, partial [Eggerthellaceae bacterium]|nr:L-serine ammonia-lyase, iron-sulfur-dependent, subunit alpha [Eggerthellaceae bacterium]
CVQHDNASLAKAFRTREYACAKAEGTSEDTDDYANKVLEVMHSSLMLPLDKPLKTMGGLISGTTHTLVEHMPASQICDDQLAHLIIYSMAVLETNASMGRIVAAPTAGSAGVIPAVLHLMREQGHTNDQLREGLYAAAAIGYLVTRNATVSGAEGGCQAEVGTASAMGAAAIVQIAGGSAAQCFDAAATALSNSMGLVCDPIGGLVEAPCQRRNAMGAANAFIGAQISLAHIPNLVPFDETVQALYKVGQSLPFELRESALGGLAATPTACAWCETRNSHHGCKSAQ